MISKNLLYILIAVAGFSLLVVLLSSQKQTTTNTVATPPPPQEQPRNSVTFEGTLQLGSSIESKSYCSEGIYVVANTDEAFENNTSVMLLKKPAGEQNTLYTDATYLDQSVKVMGIYPAQDVFCEALTCECEDYILVSKVVPKTQN